MQIPTKRSRPSQFSVIFSKSKSRNETEPISQTFGLHLQNDERLSRSIQNRAFHDIYAVKLHSRRLGCALVYMYIYSMYGIDSVL